MKKVILTLLLGFVIQIAVKANSLPEVPPDGIKVTITFEIGTPIVCAIDWSICKINVGFGFLTATAESLSATDGGAGSGSGGGGGRSWALNIPRDNFAKAYPEYLSKLDGKNTVTFNSSYTLNPEVKKALGLTGDVVVKGGVAYPLKYENGVFTITMPY